MLKLALMIRMRLEPTGEEREEDGLKDSKCAESEVISPSFACVFKRCREVQLVWSSQSTEAVGIVRKVGQRWIAACSSKVWQMQDSGTGIRREGRGSFFQRCYIVAFLVNQKKRKRKSRDPHFGCGFLHSARDFDSNDFLQHITSSLSSIPRRSTIYISAPWQASLR